MARLQHRRMDRPDEVRAYAGGRTEVFDLSDFVIGRMIMEPGWRWEVNVKPIEVGQAITVKWRGKPVFIRHRTEKDIKEAEAVPMSELPDPQTDDSRVTDTAKKVRREWLIMIGVCTHLGCVPLGNLPGQDKGPYGGWYCPCHGSAYDTSGRIRKGPAPLNLAIPQYLFTSDSLVRIG